ncbi:MAG: hypothetical protein Q9M24_06120 [Mariprofundaceae bacterium]|nr:hypothetical protein [Mariprofundaceae bacterium]
MRLIQLTLIIGLLTLLSSCGSPYRATIKNELIAHKYLSYNIPSGWEIDKEYNNYTKYTPRIYKDVAGSRYKIDVESIDYMLTPDLFDKNSDYEATARKDRESDYIKKRDKEQNITYNKTETQYIQGMKCYGTVFSRNYGGSAYDATSKNYSITCGYYDTKELKNDGKRALRIDYRYQYANPDNTRLEKDKDLKASQIPSAQVIEDNLKQQVKQIIKTIRIKNFDMERMQQEGLIHNQEFKSTKW